MIKVIRSNERHHQDIGWLSTYWHFSFSEYFDPQNLNWGPLRVFNDDVIHPGRGFGAHPHRDMEIITLVLDGQLQHKDNLGNTGIIEAGEVQVMSAGKGILHAEFNPSKEKDVHLFQLWVIPRHKGLAPRWEQKTFAPAGGNGKLLPVVSDGNVPGTLTIDQDATIYVGKLAAGQAVSHEAKPNRRHYLFVAAGEIDVNGQKLSVGDQARLFDETRLDIRAASDAQVVLLDMVDFELN